jgi:hypothetical protein
MRTFRAAGVSVGLLVSFLGATAQEPDRLPAARISRIRPVQTADARAQMPDPKTGTPMIPPCGTPMNPMTPMTGGMPPVLNQPRPLPNPTVTAETSNGAKAPTVNVPMTGTVMPVQSMPMQGSPVPGVPGAYYGVPMTGVTPPSVMPAEGQPLVQTLPSPDKPLYAASIGPTALLSGPNRLELRADLLLWWVKSSAAPALLTTSSPEFNGILGQGDTRVIYGNDQLASSLHTGGRFGTTYWLDDCKHWGLDGNIWFLGRNGKEFNTDTNQYPLLARPFYNLNQGIPFSELVAAPGLAAGSVAITTDTQIWGADANLRRAFLCGNGSKLDLMGGFRYLRMTDGITITEGFNRTADSQLGIGVPTAILGTVQDRFRTVNNFYGVNLGMVGEIRRGRWTAEGRAAVGLGTVFQTTEIYGVQNIQTTDGPVTSAGGLLALPGANIGSLTQNKFGVVPEVGFKLSYDLTTRWKVGVGYNFLYINSVLRAADQINTNLDVTRIPNFPLGGDIPALPVRQPTMPMRTTDLFTQGVTFSLQYTW